MRETLQIYILSKDRDNYLREALSSALKQASDEFNIEVIVSDNSETDGVEKLMRSEFQDVKLVRRIPFLSSHDHYRRVIDEASSDYLVIFHDDDLMLPGYAERMLRAIREHPDSVALGCNSFFFYDKAKSPVALIHGFTSIQYFKDEPNFLMQNICDPRGICPLPSYIYRRRFLSSGLVNEKEGGKYSDVSFLSKLIEYGNLIWIPDPLMMTRIHSDNDSGKFLIADKLKLVRYMVSRGINKDHPMLKLYKYISWGIWFQQSGNVIFQSINDRRASVVRRFIIYYSFRKFMTKFFYYSLYLRVKRRIFPDSRLSKFRIESNE